MRPVVRLIPLAATLALAACATLLPPQHSPAPASVQEPWVPARELPEPGEGPPLPRS